MVCKSPVFTMLWEIRGQGQVGGDTLCREEEASVGAPDILGGHWVSRGSWGAAGRQALSTNRKSKGEPSRLQGFRITGGKSGSTSPKHLPYNSHHPSMG